MLEQNSSAHIEAEIAELSAKIEEKRRILETEQGIVSDQSVVAAAIQDFVPTTSLPAHSTQSQTTDDDSYLDSLPTETEALVKDLVDKVFDRGLRRTLGEARHLAALDLDAFHDTLTDKVYAELKSRGLVN